MTPEQREHRDQQITEFRYQLVAELANPYLSAAKRRESDPAEGRSYEHEVPFLGRTPLLGGLHPQVAGCSTASTAERAWHRVRGAMPDAHAPCPDTEAAVLLNYLEDPPRANRQPPHCARCRPTVSITGYSLQPPRCPGWCAPPACTSRGPPAHRAHGAEQQPEVRVLRPAGVCSSRLPACYGPRLPDPATVAAVRTLLLRLPRRRHPAASSTPAGDSASPRSPSRPAYITSWPLMAASVKLYCDYLEEKQIPKFAGNLLRCKHIALQTSA